jgi:hypothetical protein
MKASLTLSVPRAASRAMREATLKDVLTAPRAQLFSLENEQLIIIWQ